MELAPLSPVSLDALRAFASNDGLRDGSVLKAKVEAMLSSTLARLNIEGQRVDLTTARPLPVGSTLTLKVQREDGQIRLVIQDPAKEELDAPPLPRHEASGAIGNLTDPTRTALEKFQAVTVGTMLADADAAETPWTQLTASAPHSRAQPERPDQLPPEAAAQRHPRSLIAETMPFLTDDPAPEAARQSAPRSEALDQAQLRYGAEMTARQAGPERTAAFLVDVPLFFPGNPTPLRLEVTRDDEPAAQDGEEPAAPSWMVRFAAEAGPLGMVHAAISLVDGHIGVQLLAERSDTVEQFRENAAELRTALQASDLQLDTVSIGHGSPFRPELDVR